MCEGPLYTYITMQKLIDHEIILRHDLDLVTSVKILHDDMFLVSDHLPIMAQLNLPLYKLEPSGQRVTFAWHKIKIEHIARYQTELSSMLQNLNRHSSDSMYTDLIHIISSAANNSFP